MSRRRHSQVLWSHSLAGNLTLHVLGMTSMHMASVINNTLYGFYHVIMSCTYIVQVTPLPPQHHRTFIQLVCVHIKTLIGYKDTHGPKTKLKIRTLCYNFQRQGTYMLWHTICSLPAVSS